MSARVLGERYEVGRLLGYGGMAEVLLARDTRLDRDVAIKILRSDLARDHTFQARFRREAQSAASLNHPAIVSVYDTGADQTTDPPTPYIVMEYVEGQTLRELLRQEEVLEPPQAMRITAEICGALDFSHRNGIVHRDVKPGNVMITPAGRVKVMDFGIARAVSDTAATMTATAAVVGTAQYLSPEQARGESVDARSDVYAVGCVLYELLTGAPPFVGDSPVAVAYQHVREIPKLPSSVNPSVPRDLDSIVMKALSKNPANRYQSAAAMQDDLDRAIMGEKIEAAPVLTEEEATTVVPAIPPAALPETRTYREEGEDDSRRGISGKTWALLAALLVAVLVAAFLVVPNLLGGDDPPPVQDVAVPSVVGQTLDEATATIEDADLKVGEVEQVTSSVEQANRVVAQDPSSGSEVQPGTKVNLSIGAGPAQISVPDLTGKPREEAEALLASAGLTGSFIDQDSAQSAGTVISTSPGPGASVPESSTVTVFVSTGQIQVPNVVGKTFQEASATLEAAGFTNVTEGAPVETTNPSAGTVAIQNPSAGTKASPGTARQRRSATAHPPPTTTTPPPTPSSAPPSATTTAPPPTSASPAPSTPPTG
ncbi:Stk1 family PASTA domain-containing Ser/Thr kinase [Blastococcus sp. Marseille-P5729]|uniref:Stk1 family PASTA domain-containing Ser/Thr kinase n=1 Tax=Blastococcus sp. Marseille-P5729 TaxID=2086582 RepID=UPI000D10E5C7|nr:Stk1 family PASTA domain-containing Ser/Thr kinase [Blastococcus sp. Marseille-P5729]